MEKSRAPLSPTTIDPYQISARPHSRERGDGSKGNRDLKERDAIGEPVVLM